jgi:hypothetical protein
VTLAGDRKKNIESRKGHSARKSRASIPSAQKAGTISGLWQSAGKREISGSILAGGTGQRGGVQEGGNSADSKVKISAVFWIRNFVFARNLIQPFRCGPSCTVPSLGLSRKQNFVKIKPWNLKKLRDRAEAKVGSFSQWLTTYQNKIYQKKLTDT